MSDSISFTSFKEMTNDDTFWSPITLQKEQKEFKILLDSAVFTLKHGTKDEKGKSLEKMMTYIYKRFVGVKVIPNIRLSDNQIDHEVTFPDFGSPNFIINNVGMKLIGESKNHKDSISSREVDNLDGLLKIRNAKLGIFSSYHSFSRGRKSVWENGEGKRRKLALFSNYQRVIIGFCYKDFEKILKGENFYTMLKEKYDLLLDELSDDYIEDNIYPYHVRLNNTLLHLKQIQIIPQEHYDTYKKRLINKYGELE